LFWSGNEEWVVGEADAAQLEFRVAAALGNDRVAIEEIINGADVHSITAEVLTKNGEPTTRQEAKASTFAPLAYSGLAA
jgi:DNA polymerase I-like protein with 3'-5' exonuclease and polymerase domains